MEPKLIRGSVFTDDRGELRFINDFSFDDVKRFYHVRNHRQGFVRAWHGHKKEGKYVTVLHGSALVACVQIDDWNAPSKNLPIHRFILSESAPSILFIPPGCANGMMTLTADTEITIFSTSSLDESKTDDFRFDARYWNPWTVEER